MTDSISISALFANALTKASAAYQKPTVDDDTQELIQESLTNLRKLSSLIVSLSLFSPNETLDDIASKYLAYLSLDYVLSEVESRVKTTDPQQRLILLRRGQELYRRFVSKLEDYEIIPESERAIHEKRASTLSDPAQRRALKIQQYQKEKELKEKIEVLRRKRRQQPTMTSSVPNNFDLISSLLSASVSDEEEEDLENEEHLREVSLVVLRLLYAQAQVQLESLNEEFKLLQSMPPMPPPSQPHEGIDGSSPQILHKRKDNNDNTWRLDNPSPNLGYGPLLDPSGKPLRPFTILGSNAAERTRLQSQVFGPGYNLPTMSVDEYLEVERQRGKFISGGGPASAEQPTSSEQLATDAEQDGTLFGNEKVEEKRKKDEDWARFTDVNPRGAGNTMNRG